MTTTKSAIQQIAGWESLTAEQLHAKLAETVETRIEATPGIGDTAWATGARGLRDFGPQVWEELRGALRALGMDGVVEQLSYGLDFGDPQTQAMLDQLGTMAPEQFTPERVATMKAWGVNRETRWANLGGGGDAPTTAAVQSALDEIAAERRQQAKEAAAREAYAVVSQALLDGTATTQTEAETLLTDTLAANWPEGG